MKRAASVALVALGVGLLVLGWDAYRSLSSDMSRVFTGAPTDRATWLLVAGGVATVAGLGGLSRSGR